VRLSVLKGRDRHDPLLIWTFCFFPPGLARSAMDDYVFLGRFLGRWQHVASPHLHVTIG